VPAIIGLPRFLAPGDKAIATLSLDNVEGPAGAYKVSATGEGPTTFDDSFTVSLDEGQREEGTLALSGNALGVDNLSLSVDGPNDYKQVSDYSLQVRSPFRDETRARNFSLAPGETFELTERALISYTDYVKGSVDIDLSFSSTADLNATPYIKSLSRYPYGCTEQIVATATPLLFGKI